MERLFAINDAGPVWLAAGINAAIPLNALEIAAELERLWGDFHKRSDDDPGRLMLLCEIGNLYAWLGNNVRALNAFESGRTLAREQKNAELEFQTLLAMGIMHDRMQSYDDALECFNASLPIWKSGIAAENHGSVWLGLGIVHGKRKEFERALDCFARSIDIYHQLDKPLIEADALKRIAADLISHDREAPALDYLMRALMILENHQEHRQVTAVLADITSIHWHNGSFGRALEYARHGLEAATDAADPALQGSLLLTIGEIYDRVGRVEESLNAFGQGLSVLGDMNNNVMLRYRLHEAIASVHEQRGDPVAALEHYKGYIRLREQYILEFRERKAAELQMLFDVELVERQRELAGMQEWPLHPATAGSPRAMTSLALSLVQKSRFLQELKRQVAQSADALHEEPSIAENPLLQNIMGAVDTEEVWHLFEQQFDQVHRDFMQRLAQRYPLLTPMELKICTLMRLDMTTKEIARLLSLSVRNIQNHRYRLRKKLGLASLVSLSSFLTGI